jgi:hypothetical protein
MKKENGLTPAALNAALSGDLENFLAASTPGGIEAQEARGQKEFVSNEVLPKEMLHGTTKEQFESLGFEFGDDADDLFINVKFPAGWVKKATDHSMWSDLLDEKGRKRASIFYKAAFYDRSAHISLNKRYSYSHQPEDNYLSDMSYEDRKDGNWYGVVTDCDDVIYKTEPVKNCGWEEPDKLRDEAKIWLVKKYPDYENVLAYWD